MSLLRDIQAAAIDPGTDVGTLLRKCKVLAVRLGNDDFRNWVDHKLNGYQRKEDLPPYRILDTHSYGNFTGSFGSALRNAPIPPSCIPKDFREHVSKSYLMQPISAYASFLRDGQANNLQEPWHADMMVLFGQQIYQEMNCISAWKLIPSGSVVSLVDTIKTRVLNFVLEIEGQAPDAGEAPPNDHPLSQEKVSQVFNTYITGNVSNVAAGSSQINQIVDARVVEGDFMSLREHLNSLGLASPDIEALRDAIGKDAKSGHESTIGENVQAWIGKMIGKPGLMPGRLAHLLQARFWRKLSPNISGYSDVRANIEASSGLRVLSFGDAYLISDFRGQIRNSREARGRVLHAGNLSHRTAPAPRGAQSGAEMTGTQYSFP